MGVLLILASCGGVVAQQPNTKGQPGSGTTPAATPSKAPQQATVPPGATAPPPTAPPPTAPPPTAPPPPPPPATAYVSAVDPDPFSFSPASLSIGVGTKVVFTNRSAGDDHTFSATGGAFDSGVIAPGRSYTFTFAARGSYPYFCRLHTYMKATITVS